MSKHLHVFSVYIFLSLWLPCHSVRCLTGHKVFYFDDPSFPLSENITIALECPEDQMCLRAEAKALFFSVEVSYEGTLCATQTECLQASGNCREVMAPLLDYDEDFGDEAFFQLSNCSWVCCEDDLCNANNISSIKEAAAKTKLQEKKTQNISVKSQTAENSSTKRTFSFPLLILTFLLSFSLL